VIARVRMAPFERWCPSRQKGPNVEARQKAVGKIVEILTETCRASSWCDGKQWQMNDDNVDSFRNAVGLNDRINNLGPRFVCEHMVEMD
jgi:hypothetical protein